MKERPIIFSAQMVKAIQIGIKTQTRRMVKGQHESQFVGSTGDDKKDPRNWGWLNSNDEICTLVDRGEGEPYLRCPYGVPGDRLWVKETWWMHDDPNAFAPSDGNVTDPDGNKRLVGYAATMDYDSARCAADYGCRKRPSIHMPRWASRITLELTEVRVERLQAITLPDCEAEGAPPTHPADNIWDSTATYRKLWESINGAGSWAKNPWVWVIGFKQAEVSRGSNVKGCA